MKHILLILGLTIFQVSLCANTLSGTWTKSYWQTGDVFETTNTYVRSHTYRIYFEERFRTIPRVAVSLYSFDLSYQNAGIQIEIGVVRRNYFTLRVIAPTNSYIYMAGVSWIATVDPNIEFARIAMPIDDTGSLGSGSGPRTENRQVSLPRFWRRAGATVGISGFQFSGTGNGRLDVKVSNVGRRSVNVDVSAWADTRVRMVYATVVMYSYNVDYTGSFNVQTSVTGNLYTGTGARSEAQLGGSGLDLMGRNNFDEEDDTRHSNGETQFLYGLSHIDFIYGKNYRLDQSFELEDNGLNVVFKTWADTQIWQCADNIFYSLR